MIAADPFSQYYAPFLSDTYDVVDRIVLNGYFGLGSSPGGFRCWWQQLHGTLDNLDDTHLMRMAGRFSRRVRGWAKKHNIPVIYCQAGARKHRMAEEHRPSDPKFRGVFAVLVNKAPAPVWQVVRFKGGGFHLKRRTPMPCVYHYSFHILDAEWGHITIKMSGHAPFPTQIMLNGHEYVACQARQRGIDFAKEGNCFTEVSNAAALAKVADSLRSPTAIGRLRRVCERWIYQCVCFGLSVAEQKKSCFRYSYSIYQVEYSRNLLFANGHHLEQVFQGVIDRTRGLLDLRTVKTIFGVKQRRIKKVGPSRRCESVLEIPTYDLTIFKVHFGRLTVKLYTKGECVLRAEAIVHNTAELRCGRLLDKFPQIVAKLSELLQRFLAVLRCIDVAWISEPTLETLPLPSRVGQTRVGGVDINKPRMRAVMAAVVALSSAPGGFSAAALATKVREFLGQPDGYTPRQAAYDLKKLRGKEFVRKATDQARRYEPTPDGLRAMAGLVVLREKILKPLLTQRGRCKPGPKPQATTALDAQYQAVQRQMQQLFKLLHLAA